MYEEPSDKDYQRVVSTYENAGRERGGCLTIWLVVSTLAIIMAAFALVSLFNRVSQNAELQRILPREGLYLLGVFVVVNFIGLWGIWSWKKWGVNLVAVSIIISPLIEAFLGTVTGMDIIQPIVQLAVLFYLLKDKWDYFT